MGRHQLLFSRTRTITPGGHPSAGITVHSRGDGIIVCVTDQDGGSLEGFLDTAATDNSSRC